MSVPTLPPEIETAIGALDTAAYDAGRDYRAGKITDHAKRALRTAITTALQDRHQLLRFAGIALREARVGEIGDWDGGSLQDALTACGLLEEREETVPCGSLCRCLDDGFADRGETATCYKFTPLAKEALAIPATPTEQRNP